MNNRSDNPPRPLLMLPLALLLLTSSCTNSRPGTANGQALRLATGEIKEVNLPARADTTWQLTATSDNQEVADVTRKPAESGTGNRANGRTSETAVFLIKGVTAGKANVVFTEKQAGVGGEGKVTKTYRVTVADK